MVRYRRNRIPGGMYFFTVTLHDRSSTLLTDNIGLLRAAFRVVRARRPFGTEAIVVLPDHHHMVMTLPEGDADHSARWRDIKGGFTRSLRESDVQLAAGRSAGGQVWQSRFWEHTLRDDEDLWRHINYIHWNPVKHGLVERVLDWPYSSFHRYVKDGRLPIDWGGGVVAHEGGFGE